MFAVERLFERNQSTLELDHLSRMVDELLEEENSFEQKRRNTHEDGLSLIVPEALHDDAIQWMEARDLLLGTQGVNPNFVTALPCSTLSSSRRCLVCFFLYSA
jgi:hypothetical protein